jgi:branched-chain amino acid transport system substrate-binding protein
MSSHRARFLTIGISAAVLSAMLAACSNNSNSSGGGAKSPVVLGASLSLTGQFSADGQAFEKGYKLWATDQNSAGGLMGHKIQLKFLNDNSSPTTAVANYQTLITVDKVNFTIGPFSSLLTGPSASVAHRYGYALVEGAGGAPSVFATKLNNVFDVSLPVAASLLPMINWVASLPASQRPNTAAFPTSNDPFTQPQIQFAQQRLTALGVKSLYYKVFPEEPTQVKGIADQVAAAKAKIVVLGSTAVPTVSGFTQAFIQAHYTPAVFIATAGPDQGAAYLKAVGHYNNDGVMVPNAWYGGSSNPQSKKMVAEYIAQYGGNASGVNADVAEAYSVGQVLTQAVHATHSLSNAKIIAYLHSGATLTSVQGSVKFDAVGENLAATAFVFQWQKNNFVQVLPTGTGSVAVEFPKAPWGK